MALNPLPFMLLLIPATASATIGIADDKGIIYWPGHACRREAWLKPYPVQRMVQVRRPEMVCARYDADRCVERRAQMQWQVKKETPREGGVNGE